MPQPVQRVPADMSFGHRRPASTARSGTACPMPDGRLADPGRTLGTDPRADPRMVAAFTPFGLDSPLPPLPSTVDSTLEDRLAILAAMEERFGAVFDTLAQAIPVAEGVTSTTVTIAGGGGNDLTLYISRPADTDGPLPGVVHLHGGGMAILSAADTVAVRWRENLAATGLVVVGVEFRNSAGKLGVHPYPAGLERLCGRDALGGGQPRGSRRQPADRVGRVGRGQPEPHGRAQGQAGGLAARDRRGLRAVPVHLQPLAGAARRPALADENDGYFMSGRTLPCSVPCTTPAARTRPTPPAGPGSRPTTDRRPAAACHLGQRARSTARRGPGLLPPPAPRGVSAVGRVVAGTCHAGDVLSGAMPDVYAASLRDVSGFAESVG